MKVDYIQFKERKARPQYLYDNFKHLLNGKVLDVGCDRAVLRDMLDKVEYTGIDIAGAPDITINLEEIDRLPFEDNQFDCVVCTDVLEHLDNFICFFSNCCGYRVNTW